MNPAFASRPEDIIEPYQPDLWIHGPTRVACDYEIYGTRVICDQRGYPTESRGIRSRLCRSSPSGSCSTHIGARSRRRCFCASMNNFTPELERMTGVSAGGLHRELKAMAEAGLLLCEKIGNRVFYRANTDFSIYEGLAPIFRKKMGPASLLPDALSELDDQIHVACVFGSMASGRQTAGSGLDICAPGEVSGLDGVKALSPVRETLQREINPVVMTPKKFSDLSRKKDRFVTRVLSEPILFVRANGDELAELTEDRATGRA